jgi:Cft2 family RNA processing exonuclease
MLLPYRKPVEWRGVRLTTYPAGHCLGSAMLLAEEGERSLLYTGDFKLAPSATAEAAELPRADVLVMECTFADPNYRIAPRDAVVARLVEGVAAAIDEGKTPVVHAYVLGKAQEVTRLLTSAGFPVLQHPSIYEVSQVYEACGVELGDCRGYPGKAEPGQVVIAPPRGMRNYRVPNLGPTVSFAVTGWAMDPSTKYRLGVDHAIPLSDHADFDQLLETVERVAPQEIYCTHGPEAALHDFVGRLRDAGWNARPLAPPRQTRLFCGTRKAALAR